MTALAHRGQAQASGMPLSDIVIEALDTVADPELDLPITELGFVRSISLDSTLR